MRIRTVQIEGFGCLANRSFEFGDEVTLLVGPNEAGKTTLVRAILAVLFGQEPKEREENKPWGGGTYAGAIELVENGRAVRIRRDFESEQVEITQSADGGSQTWRGTANPRGRGPEIEAYRARLHALVGFQDEALFKSTLCVEQLGLRAEIGPEIRRLLTGPTQANAEEILGNVRHAFQEVTNEGMRGRPNPRALQQCEQELEASERLYRQAWACFEEMRTLQERDASLHERLGALEEEQRHAEQLFKQIDALANAREDRDRLAREVPALSAERERIAADGREREQLTRQIEADYPGWDTLPAEYGGMLHDLGRRRQEVARARDEVERSERESAAASPAGRWLWILLPIAVLAVAYALTKLFDHFQMFMIAGAAAAAVMLLIFGVLSAQAAARRRRAVHAAAEALARYGQEQASLKTLESRLRPFMAGDDADAELNRHGRHAELRQKLALVQAVLERARDLAAVEREYHEKNAALDRVEARLTELTEANPTLKRFLGEEDPGQRREALRADIQRRGSELERLRGERFRVRAELEARRRQEVANEPALRGEIDGLKERRAELVRRGDALKVATDVLGETIKEYHTVHRGALAEKIGTLYARLTAGRYERVRLDEGFAPSLDGVGQSGLGVERVSQGARDQLYFAMRVAVAEELSGQVRLPFLLDDPFVNFDDERLAAVYDVLGELATRHQFVVLTHNPREKAFAPTCLELG
jgi:DNA repair exonuclease SbcCD ATPase subunit